MNTAQLNGFGRALATRETSRRTIPFDYAFRFDLTGEPGNVLNSTIEVSIEADFTAVSIGYGVVPTAQPIVFGLPLVKLSGAAVKSLFDFTIGELLIELSNALDEGGKIGARTAVVLADGLRFNPEFAEHIFLTFPASAGLDEGTLNHAFQAVGAPPERVAFKYALFDQGSGREFQSEAILNIAGLGSPDGKRPFRYFAQPIELPARSVIRMEITEVSAFQGELHIALQGYKTLGQPGTPTGSAQRHHGRMRR